MLSSEVTKEQFNALGAGRIIEPSLASKESIGGKALGVTGVILILAGGLMTAFIRYNIRKK